LLAILTAPTKATTEPVRISLSLSKDSYYFTEPIPTTYTIQNMSRTTLLLPKDIIEFPKGNPNFDILEEKSGQRVNSLRRVFDAYWGVPLFEACVALRPGETFSRSLDLLAIYYPVHYVGGPRLDRAGSFRATFVYGNSFLTAQATTYTALRGAYRSNTVVFALRPPTQEERAPFLADLDSKDRGRVRRALDCLSMAQDGHVLPRLHALLNDPVLQLQEAACDNLTYFGENAEVLARLIRKASDDPTDMGRLYAVAALEQIGNPACVPALVSICSDARFPKASVVAARVLLNRFEAVEHLDKIEAVMKREFGAKGSVTWESKIRQMRKKTGK